MNWEIVIGLETHTQLPPTPRSFGQQHRYGAAANTQANVIDLALPGSLPVMNRGAAERAIRFGLAGRRDRAALGVRAQELLTPTCPRATRSASTSCRWWWAARSPSSAKRKRPST